MARRQAESVARSAAGSPAAGFGLDAVADTAAACAGAGLACQQELMRFALRRWQADLAHTAALKRCRDVGELTALQQEWVAETVRDYGEQGARLAGIAGGTLGDGASRLRAAAGELDVEAARLIQESGQLIE